MAIVFPQVCIAATGVVGDLCRALGPAILPLCDEIMNSFVEGLAVSSSFLLCKYFLCT